MLILFISNTQYLIKLFIALSFHDHNHVTRNFENADPLMYTSFSISFAQPQNNILRSRLKQIQEAIHMKHFLATISTNTCVLLKLMIHIFVLITR